MELFLESFDLAKMIDEVASTIRPMVEKNANTLQIQRAPDLGMMHADQIKVRHRLCSICYPTSGLIHALRTQLNLTIGYSEMLMEQAQVQAQEEFVPDLQRILDAGKQLLALIH